MTDKLKPYPKYKDAGLPWLGSIPSHWGIRRIKALVLEVDRRSSTGAEPLLSMTRASGLVRYDTIQRKVRSIVDLIGYKVCKPDEIVMNKMQAWSGMFARASEEGLVSPDYTVLKPIDHLKTEFLVALFRSPLMVSKFAAESKGIGSGFFRLYTDCFDAIPIPYPPFDEQVAIHRYISFFENQFRKYIKLKLLLIKLLNEHKQAIITNTIRRGLDQNIRCKPSGIEWLGDIPEHWTYSKLKYLTQFDNGIAFKPSDWKDTGVPIIRIQNLNGSENFNYTDRTDLPANLLIAPTELLFSWSGNRGTSFGAFKWDRPFSAYLNQHIFKLSKYQYDPNYFYYLLQAVTRYIEEQTHGIIGLVHITKPELGGIFVPIPPKDEQLAITCYLDRKCQSFNEAIQNCRQQIIRIRELRSVLVSDAVTGKVDVRDMSTEMISYNGTELIPKSLDKYIDEDVDADQNDDTDEAEA